MKYRPCLRKQQHFIQSRRKLLLFSLVHLTMRKLNRVEQQIFLGSFYYYQNKSSSERDISKQNHKSHF